MINKTLFIIFSTLNTVLSIRDVYNSSYTGIYFEFNGCKAVVAGLISLFISVCALSNLFHSWIRWLKPKDWPWFIFASILVEIVVEYIWKTAKIVRCFI